MPGDVKIPENSEVIQKQLEIVWDYQHKYFQLLRDKLITQGYNSTVYTQNEEVMNIIESGIKFFCDLFVSWCIQNIRSSKDVGKIIWVYSLYEKDKNSNLVSLSHLDTIGLYTCRYVLALSPILKLSKKQQPIITDNVVWLPELFAMTESLGYLAQFRCVCGLSESNIVSIDLTESYFKISYTNSEYENLFHKSKIKGDSILAPQFIDYESAINFDNLLRTIFGQAASSLLDTLSMYDPEDINNVIPKDFSPYYEAYGNSIFAKELILDKNSVDFYNVVTKPHSQNFRTRFKPLIELDIDDQKILISSIWLIFEAFSEICNNSLPFNGLPHTWLKIPQIKQFADKTSNLVGEEFEKLIISKIHKKFPLKANITHIGNVTVEDCKVFHEGIDTGRTVGEIDFIIINNVKRIIYIADAKHLKSKYITASFYNDKSKFDTYYIKLQDKLEWAKNNTYLISKLFGFDVSSYEIQELFITDAFVFYALFVPYPIIPLIAINEFLLTNNKLRYI